ncbi:MAG: hypothetical protein RQ741_05930, partial [Wenzhouxiangellaceae bacterium]|nr:hypothetical protein [Wenzhouxiangellaceae bacterium]
RNVIEEIVRIPFPLKSCHIVSLMGDVPPPSDRSVTEFGRCGNCSGSSHANDAKRAGQTRKIYPHPGDFSETASNCLE